MLKVDLCCCFIIFLSVSVCLSFFICLSLSFFLSVCLSLCPPFARSENLQAVRGVTHLTGGPGGLAGSRQPTHVPGAVHLL